MGTFGIGSAAYWWARLAAGLARISITFQERRCLWQWLYADALRWTTTGLYLYCDSLLFLVMWSALGKPYSCGKGKGGLSCDFVGYWMDYQRFETGMTVPG